MTTPSTTRSDLIADRLAKAMQEACEEIGATEQQRIAFAYAEAAMRHELPAALTPPVEKDDGEMGVRHG